MLISESFDTDSEQSKKLDSSFVSDYFEQGEKLECPVVSDDSEQDKKLECSVVPGDSQQGKKLGCSVVSDDSEQGEKLGSAVTSEGSNLYFEPSQKLILLDFGIEGSLVIKREINAMTKCAYVVDSNYTQYCINKGDTINVMTPDTM